MKLTQDEVVKYLSKNGLEENTVHQALNVAEEAGEVARAVLKRVQGIRGTYEHWTDEIRKEAADVMISLMCLAQIEGWDLGMAVDERWNYVINREMDKHRHEAS